jgi:predicted anti-sigma-YlaC factor YlaD
MKCERAFNRYLELDKNERVPLMVTAHLLVCPACRTGVRAMTKAEFRLSSPLAVEASQAPFFSPELSPSRACSADPAVAAAMARIVSSGLAYPQIKRPVSFTRWLVTGIVLAAGFAVMPVTFGAWSQSVFGSSYSVPFYLLSGIAVTIYGGLFIGTNIDFFVKKFGFEHTAGNPA